MASAQFLEEALSTDVDESAMSAVVGSLKTQFTTPSSSLPHRALSNQNSVTRSDSSETVFPKLLISDPLKVLSEEKLNLMSNGANSSSVVGVHGGQHPGGPTMTVNVTSGSSGVTGNSQNKTTVLTKPPQVGMTMTMAPISTSLASMSPAPASTVVGSNNTLVSSLESQISSSQNLIPNINHLNNRGESDGGGKTVLLNNVIPHNPTGGTPNGLQSLGVHSAGSTSSGNSVLTPQHLAAMTVNVAGTGGQTTPNQAVVLGKHPQAGIVPSSSPLGSVSPATLGGTSTSLSGPGNPGQTPTIISTAGGGIRILNMNVNAVQAAAVGAGSTGNVQAGGVAGNAAQKALAPRMILSPQMIGARPGQPGVQEYQSEFSEFLMLNYKQNVNEEPERECREDDCIEDPGFSKTTEDVLSNDDIPPVVEECPVENAKSKDLDIENELTLDPDSKLSDSELFPEHPSLILTPLVDEADLSPEKSDCSEMSFLQAFPTQYDCVQAPSEQNLPESVCCDIDDAVQTEKSSNNYSNETTFFSASHQEQNSYQKQSNTELPDNSKLPACQLAVPNEVSFDQDFNPSRTGREISDWLYNSSGDEADRAAKDYGRQSLIVTRSLPHATLSVSTSQSFLNSPPAVRYSAYSPVQSVVTMASSSFSQKVPQQQHHTSSPIHARVPPHPHQQPNTIQQHPHNSSNNKFTSIPSEYKTKCFTNDAQLQSQFLRYNQQYPINVPQSPSKTAPATRLPLKQNHHSTFPQQHPYNREVVAHSNYNSQTSIPTVGQVDSSSRSLTNVQHASIQCSPYHPRPGAVLPNSGCDYFPPSSSSSFPYSHHPLQPSHPPGHHEPHHSHGHASMPGQPHNRINPQHHSPNVSRPAQSASKTQSPNSYSMNPRWMAISPNNSSGNISSSNVTKDGCVNSPVIRYGQTVRDPPPPGNLSNANIRYHSPVAAPQVSPTINCGYIVSYNSPRMPTSGSRYPIPSRQTVQDQGHVNIGNSSSSNSRVQNMSQSRPTFPHYVQEHYSRPSGGGQCMQNQQYFQAGSSGGGSQSGSNTNCSVSNSSQHPGAYPLVCRVSPIRSRFEEGSSNFPVNSYPQSGNRYPSRPIPHVVSSVPGSLATAHDPNANFQAVASGAGRQDFNYPYESQYNDARNLRTQITLQALPGLPPGAQGHHLLVKTENGQYQLLRVGMSTQPQAPPTAASGTNPPPPAPTTSIAQSSSTPSIISSPSVASSSTVMTTSLQQPNLTVGTMTPTNNVNIVTSNSGTAVLNSIMANAVNSPRLPMATSNLVHTNNISAVPTASSNSVISSTTIPSPVLPASPHATATYRLQTVPTVPPTAASNSSGMGMTMQPQVYPQHPQTVQGSPSVASNASATANSVSQMTAETAKMKCKNFLSFLLELSAKQNATVARNVKTLIQGLVDGKVNAEDFSDRLQKEVNSQPQPCLVGFLKKSLPHLRQSLATKELTIDGIKAPALSSVGPTAPVTALIPQNQVRPQAIPTPVRIITPINASSSPNTTNTPAPIPRSTVTAVQQRFAAPSKSNASSARSNSSNKSNASSNSAASSPSASVSSSSSTPKSSGPSSSKTNAKDKDKKGAAAAAFSGYSGDDDINDVAAMGGVNLAEESQRILGSTEFVGTQIRSCKDESFLPAMLLQSRIKATASKYGLEDCSPEVAAMISHATEERLKNLLEKLSVIAEHRLDVIKIDERYEISQDVKGQLRFLEELDKLERKRHDEQEREILIKAAKSRSKSEDPEQAKLKAKAKEMQRVALEELRQKEANLTALQAIGPRKKPKLDTPAGSQSTTAQTSLGGQGASSNLSRPQIGMRPRLKRVNLRDLLFLMEQDKETQRSHFLYKNLLLK
ncbi:unnamed protein product [Allacma fusca]|uniref:TAFH domain-containing protein n=1 Tax=Allacma fusca TaxID=39272 RepID=A0A8J2NJM1_9HEXA|nr:unnamed protein product [Allacma fusca]